LGKITGLKPVVSLGQCSALAARTAGGFCVENMLYQMDTSENRVGHYVQSHLHQFADGDFHIPDRVSVESYLPTN
jgi:hypothetical protein